jgi:hypothetical protein
VVNAPGERLWFDFRTNQAIHGDFPHNTIATRTWQIGGPVDPSNLTYNLYQQTGSDKYVLSSYQPIDLVQANPQGFAVPYVPPPDMSTSDSVSDIAVELPHLKGALNLSGGTNPKHYWFTITLSNYPLSQQVDQNPISYLTYLTSLQYLISKGIDANVELFGEGEATQIGFDFDDHASKPPTCGPLPSQLPCSNWVQTEDEQPMPIPVVPGLRGPFSDHAMPYEWVMWKEPPTPIVKTGQIGQDYNGGKFFPISLRREDNGNPSCYTDPTIGATPPSDPNACSMVIISRPYGDTYVYVYYYTVVHEIP